jgi:hypothetical protein
MADSILPQPGLRAPMEFVQGGGGPNTNAASSVASVGSVESDVRAGINSEKITEPTDAKLLATAQLKVLTNGLTVRYVSDKIKDDIMNLRFIKGEQELFDKHLRFNNKFIRKYIGSESSDSEASTEGVTEITDTDTALLNGNSIDAVEVWVKAKATKLDITLGDQSMTKPENDLSIDEYSVFGDIGLRRMKSSGNDNDCLVHSLLTSTSETFRKMDKGGKDVIASLFRRTILVNLYDSLIKADPKKEELKTMKKDLLSTRNLDLDIASKFAVKYNINILLRDRDRFGDTNPWTIVNDSPTNNIIIIYNPGKNHFEGVSNLVGKYVFEYSFIDKWASKIVFKDKENLACKFKNGDDITHGTDEFKVLVTGLKDGACNYVYVVNMNDTRDITKLRKDVDAGIIIKEAIDQEKEDVEKRKRLKGDALAQYIIEYTHKKSRKDELLISGNVNIDSIPGVINIADTLDEYTLIEDTSAGPASTGAASSASSPSGAPGAPGAPGAAATATATAPDASTASTASTAATAASPTGASPADAAKPKSKVKTPQEKFYDFWEIYINEDGTDGFHRMTGRKANAMKAYLDDIGRAYEDYLLKSALRYLQREEDPVLFDSIYEKPKDTLFDMFFTVVKVPIDEVKERVENKATPEVKEDKFTQVTKQLSVMEDELKVAFGEYNIKYNEFINESKIESDPPNLGTINTLLNDMGAKGKSIQEKGTAVLKIINEYKLNKIRKDVELRSVTDIKVKEALTKELESIRKIIEDSKGIEGYVNRYNTTIRLSNDVQGIYRQYINLPKTTKMSIKSVLQDKYTGKKEEYRVYVENIDNAEHSADFEKKRIAKAVESSKIAELAEAEAAAKAEQEMIKQQAATAEAKRVAAAAARAAREQSLKEKVKPTLLKPSGRANTTRRLRTLSEKGRAAAEAAERHAAINAEAKAAAKAAGTARVDPAANLKKHRAKVAKQAKEAQATAAPKPNQVSNIESEASGTGSDANEENNSDAESEKPLPPAKRTAAAKAKAKAAAEKVKGAKAATPAATPAAPPRRKKRDTRKRRPI